MIPLSVTLRPVDIDDRVPRVTETRRRGVEAWTNIDHGSHSKCEAQPQATIGTDIIGVHSVSASQRRCDVELFLGANVIWSHQGRMSYPCPF
ncbi:hypothetical protein LSAT2_021215 [Lamellibrachia satsuma]|nr:hypothetical protein LSAT2_021215 [Lamellibrachia satsuma]